MTTNTQIIKLAVSQCLLGDNVRYDGSSNLCTEISNLSIPNIQFNIIPFCPEVAIGMGTPRLPIQLDSVADMNRARRVNNPVEDFTEALKSYAQSFISEHADLIGLINKKGSPSCGYKSTKLYFNNQLVGTDASGIFLAELKSLKPEIIIIDEIGLENTEIREDFLCNIKQKAL
ncbi:MAG: DUF523 domain-containing protein [Gammaproteobacteria bacterium]|nr:DUF523 domain-containing protein [Gammaproteobacteria bacterium]